MQSGFRYTPQSAVQWRERRYKGGAPNRNKEKTSDFTQWGRILTFFFSKFPEYYNNTDFWKVFQSWGKVWEVFIANRRNRWGQRYGFVRFSGVENDKILEQQLDRIKIGNIKMHVNIPCYKKNEWSNGNNGKNLQTQLGKIEEQKGRNMGFKRKTYAQVVQGGLMKGNVEWKPKQKQHSHEGEGVDRWLGQDIDVPEENVKWLEQCWVGRLKDITMFERLTETCFLLDVKMRYIIDDMVLISGIIEEGLQERIRNENDIFTHFFTSIEKWRLGIWTGNRVTWVKCIGIPIQQWGVSCFSQVIGVRGNMIHIDKDTKKCNKLDQARLLIRTTSFEPIWYSTRIRINGVIREIQVIEETGVKTRVCNCWRWQKHISSFEESSMASDYG
ncbi:uncharacterized protein LOC109792041 [Cajanus cajan]|uniref:uncharacterized protein LOC109792041 n=1 Tax=Cajanus cajan TaxID=3821 RepID=UPI00098D89DC|nr:uncharacterized protein LOC109792041 [Cajanus cajan]